MAGGPVRGRREARRRRERGFTLLELLVTLVISVFGIMGIMALHASLTRGTSDAGRSQEAVAVGGQVLESLRSKRIADMTDAITGSPSTTPPFANPTFKTMLGRNGLSYAVGVDVVAVSTELWRLRVEVTWTEDTTGVTRTIPLEVLRTIREAL